MEDCCSHPALEPLPLSEGECVCLGDDRNHIDLIVNGLHELNIQGLQAGGTGNREARGSKTVTVMSEWKKVKRRHF